MSTVRYWFNNKYDYRRILISDRLSYLYVQNNVFASSWREANDLIRSLSLSHPRVPTPPPPSSTTREDAILGAPGAFDSLGAHRDLALVAA